MSKLFVLRLLMASREFVLCKSGRAVMLRKVRVPTQFRAARGARTNRRSRHLCPTKVQVAASNRALVEVGGGWSGRPWVQVPPPPPLCLQESSDSSLAFRCRFRRGIGSPKCLFPAIAVVSERKANPSRLQSNLSKMRPHDFPRSISQRLSSLFRETI